MRIGTTRERRRPGITLRLPPPTSARDRATVLFFGVLVVYLLTASYTSQSVDTASNYYPAWQLAHYGNVTMDAFSDKPLWFAEADGRVVPARFPGATWLAVPLYLLDNSSSPSAGLANLAAGATAAGAVVLVYLLSGRLAGERTALGAALVVAFATPTWTVSGDALWTHGPGQLWLLLGVLLAVRGALFSSGLAFGAALLTRPHYALVAAVVGIMDAAHRRRSSALVKIGLGTSVGLVLLLAYNRQVFSDWGIRTGYSSDISQASGVGLISFLENIAGTLVSPSRGVLVMTPFLCLLLPGCRQAWREAPTWVRSAALGGTVYMVTQLWLNRWSGGYAFYSYRLSIEWLTLSTPLLVMAYTRWTSRTACRRVLFLALVTCSAALHAIGAITYQAERVEPNYWLLWQPWSTWADRPLLASGAAVVAATGALLGAMALRSRPAGVRGATAPK